MSETRDLPELLRNWTPPVELQGSGPRPVRLSAAGKAMVGLAVLMVLGAVVGAVLLSRMAAREAVEEAALESAGAQAQGIVTRHWRTTSERHPRGAGSDTHKVAYEFEYQGRTYHRSVNAPIRIWRDLAVGSPISVRFLPDNPEVNHPAAWERKTVPAWVPPLLAGSLALIAMALVIAIRRQMRLLSEGRAAPAVVTGHRRVKHGQMLVYEFPLLNGASMKGRGGQTRRPPAIGSTITVLYDRDNPKRSAPYPLELARIDR